MADENKLSSESLTSGKESIFWREISEVLSREREEARKALEECGAESLKFYQLTVKLIDLFLNIPDTLIQGRSAGEKLDELKQGHESTTGSDADDEGR